MKFLKIALSVVAFALMATSCGGNENLLHDNYLEQNFTGSLNVLSKEGANGELVSVVSEGTTYKFRWRYDNTADVYIYNAKFSTNMPNGIAVAFEGLQWTYAEGNVEIKVLKAKDLLPTWVEMNGQKLNDLSNFMVDELEISVYERRWSYSNLEYYHPIINLSMKIGDVEVVAVQKQRFYFGSTAVIGQGDQPYYSAPKPFYLVSLNPTTGLATIDVYGAKFADKMPSLNMKFDGVLFDVSNLGYTLSCDELIPTIKEGEKDIPYPQYAITNLKGNANFNTGMALQFDCMGLNVQAQLGFPIVVE